MTERIFLLSLQSRSRFPKTRWVGLTVVSGENSASRRAIKTPENIVVMLIGNDLNYTELYPLLEAAQVKLGRQVNPTCYAPYEWAQKRKEDNHFIMQVIKQPKIFIVGNDDELSSIR